VTSIASRLVCAGCGGAPREDEPYPFRCPNALRDDDVDHVLRRELDLAACNSLLQAEGRPVIRAEKPGPRPARNRLLQALSGDGDPNPYVRFRGLLHAYHLARARGVSDEAFVGLVRDLDEQVAAVDGHGFVVTPFFRSAALSEALGFSKTGGVWVKDETRNVSGSHKARHLFGVLVWLEVTERVGLADPGSRPRLAIASCGNAALAAAVVARAGGRELEVCVPPDADPVVLDQLEALGALVTPCPRDGLPGDPTYRRLLLAIDDGAVPFTCQGNLNGLAIEGGETLGWEIASSGETVDRLVIHVGGGALASACIHSLREGVALGALAAMPRIDTVQTEGAWPLKRAFDELRRAGGAKEALRFASHHRSSFMWPWEEEPHSIAHGILDDETYDWLAVVEGMLATGGDALVVDEESLVAANALAKETTRIDVVHTGSAGLAGLMALRAIGRVADDERVAVLFTGVVRAAPDERRERDEELPRAGHPVAQGL
jgi:threonine synthase